MPVEFEAKIEDDMKLLEESKQFQHVQNSSVFKNVSTNMIRTLENCPKVDDLDQEDFQLESLVFG